MFISILSKGRWDIHNIFLSGKDPSSTNSAKISKISMGILINFLELGNMFPIQSWELVPKELFSLWNPNSNYNKDKRKDNHKCKNRKQCNLISKLDIHFGRITFDQKYKANSEVSYWRIITVKLRKFWIISKNLNLAYV